MNVIDYTTPLPSKLRTRYLIAVSVLILIVTLTAALTMVAQLLVILITLCCVFVITLQRPVTIRMIFDGENWYWECNGEPMQRITLTKAVHYAQVKHLLFETEQGIFRHTLWQDQISEQTWRRLSIVTLLKQNNNNLFI